MAFRTSMRWAFFPGRFAFFLPPPFFFHSPFCLFFPSFFPSFFSSLLFLFFLPFRARRRLRPVTLRDRRRRCG